MDNLRISSYIISVKLESEKDKYMLIHGYTGAIDIIEGKYWNALKRFSEDNSFGEETISLFQKRGYITNKTESEEYDYVMKLAHLLHQKQQALHKTFGFLVTYNCNFRCPYCFESTISNHGCQWSKEVLDKKRVDDAYKAMLRIESHRELHNKEILLYGGEPLLRENKDIVAYIIQEGEKFGYLFKVITNGYDLDYFEELLSPDLFTSFQITLDGYRECHNQRRKHYSEDGSFDKIISNIAVLLKHDLKVRVRVNVDEKNFPDIDKLNDLFKKLGYSNNNKFNVYYSSLREYENNMEKTSNIAYIPLVKFSDKFSKGDIGEMSYQDFGIYKRFCYYLKNKSRCELRAVSCSSQYGSYIFDPNGEIYTCLETVGKKEHVVGCYTGDTIEWTESKKNWFGRNITKISHCKHCKYALLCGGGCPAHVPYKQNGFGNSKCNNYRSVFPVSVNRAYDAYINSK